MNERKYSARARQSNLSPSTARPCSAVENVEFVENAAQQNGNSDSPSTFSTHSTPTLDLSAAIIPMGSWLERYLDYARKREESADCYLVGSILPVVSIALARRVWFPWGDGRVFPNLFTMLAGKPGDRKSSAINLAERVGRIVIEPKHFLPDAMSSEAMFDEYDEERGGAPDKILIADDANPFLGMLQKSNYGERVGQRLLNLYDCKGLGEAFRRNKDTGEGNVRRFISQTSTSMVLGATLNICQFQGHEIRSGLQRRFLYYLAEKHGRFIPIPASVDQMDLGEVCTRLAKLTKSQGVEFQFTPDANELWTQFQVRNRELLQRDGLDSTQIAGLSRLNGHPNHVLKIAMVFQASVWAENDSAPTGLIEATILKSAIEHTELCLAAAQALDSIANRAQIQQDADVLLARIAVDFAERAVKGTIQLTRTDLTGRYAHHSGRKGALSPDELYLRLIPDLVRRGKAWEIPRSAKQPAFAFKLEELPQLASQG